MNQKIKWILFVLYLCLFTVLPLYLLWDLPGLMAGAFMVLFTLLWLMVGGTEKILTHMKAGFLPPTVHPHLHFMVKEYSRRLGIPAPRIAWMETAALNAGVFGFNVKRAVLVVTKGLVDELSREELSAVIAREMAALWTKEFINESWLTRVMRFGDRVFRNISREKNLQRGSMTSFVGVTQILFLFPLMQIPKLLLRGRSEPDELNRKAALLSRNPEALHEAYKKFEAFRFRRKMEVPFSCSHLFLSPPCDTAPWLNLLFEPKALGDVG